MIKLERLALRGLGFAGRRGETSFLCLSSVPSSASARPGRAL